MAFFTNKCEEQSMQKHIRKTESDLKNSFDKMLNTFNYGYKIKDCITINIRADGGLSLSILYNRFTLFECVGLLCSEAIVILLCLCLHEQ